MERQRPIGHRMRQRGKIARALRSIAGLTALVIVVGIVWRVGRYALNFPIWGDEASVAASLFTRDFAGMIKPPLALNQIAPLGYMWLELALVKALGMSEWVLRLPAFVCGLAAFLLFWRLAR